PKLLQTSRKIGALRRIPINSIFAPFFGEAIRASPIVSLAFPYQSPNVRISHRRQVFFVGVWRHSFSMWRTP
ncbi:MAG: hypothetical protein LW805_10170, partial [Oxalobacteraceae bacterium]|nr:hypothetical protein [Oxalobacteraceae bacterium]